MICDSLVVGISDIALSKRLQMEPDLYLDKAKRSLASGKPSRSNRVPQISAPVSKSSLEVANHAARTRQPQKHRHHQLQSARGPCTWCGKSHATKSCPAIDASCWKCSKRGHYARVCRCKNLAALEEATDIFEMVYLNSMEQHLAASTTTWTAEVTINRKVIPFKLDTKAKATAISEEAFQMNGKPNLLRPSKQFCGPDKKPLEVLGSFTNSPHRLSHSPCSWESSWALSMSGHGDRTKKTSLPEFRQRWTHPVFWTCTAQGSYHGLHGCIITWLRAMLL